MKARKTLYEHFFPNMPVAGRPTGGLLGRPSLLAQVNFKPHLVVNGSMKPMFPFMANTVSNCGFRTDFVDNEAQYTIDAEDFVRCDSLSVRY